MEEHSSLLADNVHISPKNDDLSAFLEALSRDATRSNKKDFSYPASKHKLEFVALVKDIQNLVSTAKAESEPVTGQDETIAQRHCLYMMKKLVAYHRYNFDSCVGLTRSTPTRPNHQRTVILFDLPLYPSKRKV